MAEIENLIYNTFNQDISKDVERYRQLYFGGYVKFVEKLGKLSHKIIKVSGNKKDKEKYEEIRREALLDLSYEEHLSLKYSSILFSFILGFILTFIFVNPLFFLIFILIGLILYLFVDKFPSFVLSNVKVMKKGQLAFFLLLLAIKLRENPNLEQAFIFALKYIDPPLKLDLLLILRDTVNKKYSSIKEALDFYSKVWEDEAYYFVIGLQFLISSLYESDPIKREILVDKSVEESLEQLFLQLSAFARELQSPINLVGMLGITFPTLLLTVLPLASILLANLLPMSVIFILFNVVIPIIVYINIKEFIENRKIELTLRSNAYLEALKEKENRKKMISFGIALSSGILIFFILAFIVYNYISSYQLSAIILSGVFILSVSLAVSIFYYVYYSYYRNIEISLDKINREFSSFLFTIGTNLMDNLPLEVALIKSYQKFKGKEIAKFIGNIYKNMKMGYSLNDAIFDKKVGAIRMYPSPFVESGMELLVEGSMVSPQSAGRVSLSLSKYFTYIERVRERLLDLVAETISQIKSLAKILAPSILAVVNAVTLLSLNVLFHLTSVLQQINTLGQETYTQYISAVPMDILSLFTFGTGITPAQIYITIGIFNVILAGLMGYMLAVVEHGKDKIKILKSVYQNVLISGIIFFILSILMSIALWMFASGLLSNVISGL